MRCMLFAFLVLFAIPFFVCHAHAQPPPPPAPHVHAVVTFTRWDGSTWIDGGTVVEDHQLPSPRKGYTYRFVVFTDHVNEYHLDEGTVDIVYTVEL